MYILTIKQQNKYGLTEVQTEVFTQKFFAVKDFFAAIRRYEKEKGLFFDFSEKEEEKLRKIGIFEHENFGVYISEPDTDYQLIEEMYDSEIVNYLEENCRNWDMYLSKSGIQELVENIEGNGYYLLRYNNLVEEMKAKEIAEDFGK